MNQPNRDYDNYDYLPASTGDWPIVYEDKFFARSPASYASVGGTRALSKKRDRDPWNEGSLTDIDHRWGTLCVGKGTK